MVAVLLQWQVFQAQLFWIWFKYLNIFVGCWLMNTSVWLKYLHLIGQLSMTSRYQM